MTINKMQLTPNDILEKDFKKSMRGYNEEEVDAYLDMIIKDYEIMTKEIKKLKEENERFKQNTEQKPRAKTVTNNPQVNYDVLKRLSNLEKAVFGQKVNEQQS